MDFKDIVREKVRSCNLEPAREAEIVDEISQHMRDRYESLVRSGLDEQEAAKKIAAEFSARDLAQELRATERVWKEPVALGADKGEGLLTGIWQDARYAVRSLRKTPLLAVVVIASLGLGIGANTAIFSLMDALMLRFLPVQHPEELVKLQMQDPGRPANDTSFTNAMWEATRDQQNVFSSAFATSGVQQIDLAHGGAAQNINGVFVSGGYFGTLGLNPAAGRLIANADDHRGCAPIAVLSYAFWQSHFGGAESAVGSTISLRGHPFEIVGVAPPGFYGIVVGKAFDVAMPLCASAPFDQRNLDSRGRWWLEVMGRAKPGLSLDQIRSGLGVISPGVMTASVPPGNPDYQKRFERRKLAAAPAGAGISDLRGTFRDPLRVLMAIVALVLLIACANITSLMLARTMVRSKEIAIRKALGASRARLARQLITESVLLSLLGATAGLLFAKWGSAMLVRTLSTGRNPLYLDLTPDGNVLLFTVSIAVITGVLMGTLPALRSTRVELIEAMKARTGDGDDRALWRVELWR